MFISVASMALGSFAAIGQTNIKRLMAYSSIGHMGFALVGLAAANEAGVRGVAIYLAPSISSPRSACSRRSSPCANAAGPQRREHFRSRRPVAHRRLDGFFLSMLMFSLAGIPPLAGFFAKYYAFLAAVQAG